MKSESLLTFDLNVVSLEPSNFQSHSLHSGSIHIEKWIHKHLIITTDIVILYLDQGHTSTKWKSWNSELSEGLENSLSLDWRWVASSPEGESVGPPDTIGTWKRKFKPLILNWGVILPHIGYLATFGDIVHCHEWGAGMGSQHLMGRSQGASKHSTVHKLAPETKNSLAQRVTGTEVEKPGSKFIQSCVWELRPHF